MNVVRLSTFSDNFEKYVGGVNDCCESFLRILWTVGSQRVRELSLYSLGVVSSY
jgi:hypothetical protein